MIDTKLFLNNLNKLNINVSDPSLEFKKIDSNNDNLISFLEFADYVYTDSLANKAIMIDPDSILKALNKNNVKIS